MLDFVSERQFSVMRCGFTNMCKVVIFASLQKPLENRMSTCLGQFMLKIKVRKL